MNIIKLLDVSSPKTIKDTLNSLIEHYTALEANINSTADGAVAKAEEAITISNTALGAANNAVQTANTAQQTSVEAKQTAEESLAISSQAETTADNAKTLAESAFTESDEANLTAESALNIATEARAVIDHALETGALGTIVRDMDGTFLINVHRTEDMNVEDTATDKYILAPKAVSAELNKIKEEVGGGLPTIEYYW